MRGGTTTDDLLAAVANADGVGDVLGAVLTHALTVSSADGAGIFTADSQPQVIVTAGAKTEYESANETSDRDIDLATIVRRVARKRDTILVADRFGTPAGTIANETDPRHRTVLGVPLIASQRVYGVMVLSRREPRPFSDGEVARIRPLAYQAAIALEVRRVRGELDDAIEQQEATTAVMQILSTTAFNPQAVFREIVASALRLCKADNATLALLEGDRARVVSNAGTFADEAAYIKTFGDLPLRADRSTITGRVLLERAVVHIPELHDAGLELRRATGPATGARAVVAAPLLRDGEVLGILFVRRRQPGPFSGRQIHVLETFATQAVIAIENTRLFGTVKRQAEELARFVAPQVAQVIASDERDRLLEAHRRQISVLFCDLRGFTAFAQAADPEEVLRVLREYHRAMGELVVKHGGTLEHFAGDGMMIFFNDPVPIEHHELAALGLGMAMRERFAELATLWGRRGYNLGLGIGVANGYATLGQIGFEGRYEYGAVGNVVILASRLSTQAAAGQILITQPVYAATEDHVDAAPAGEFDLKGIGRPTPAFAVTAVRDRPRLG